MTAFEHLFFHYIIHKILTTIGDKKMNLKEAIVSIIEAVQDLEDIAKDVASDPNKAEYISKALDAADHLRDAAKALGIDL